MSVAEYLIIGVIFSVGGLFIFFTTVLDIMSSREVVRGHCYMCMSHLNEGRKSGSVTNNKPLCYNCSRESDKARHEIQQSESNARRLKNEWRGVL